jgi:hypothetical protein
MVTRRFEALLSECAAEYLLFWAFQEGFSARMQRVLQSERRHWKALVAATGRRRLMKGFGRLIVPIGNGVHLKDKLGVSKIAISGDMKRCCHRCL